MWYVQAGCSWLILKTFWAQHKSFWLVFYEVLHISCWCNVCLFFSHWNPYWPPKSSEKSVLYWPLRVTDIICNSTFRWGISPQKTQKMKIKNNNKPALHFAASTHLKVRLCTCLKFTRKSYKKKKKNLLALSGCGLRVPLHSHYSKYQNLC